MDPVCATHFLHISQLGNFIDYLFLRAQGAVYKDVCSRHMSVKEDKISI
jgi:hypothetical protein